ncbi:MAG: hypothetical protein ACK41O_07825 [Runella zeae]
MMKQLLRIIVWLLSFAHLTNHNTIYAQCITTSIPKTIETHKIYLFYLHGGIVQDEGPHAVSKYYGKYEYYPILDSLSMKGFHVISEVRPKGTNEVEYAKKISLQIDTLISFGVPMQNILIVGASLGAYIALEVALITKKTQLNYVLIGLCSKYAIDYYSQHSDIFQGKFLSIYEKTDTKGSCSKIFTNKRNVEFEEIELNMGIGHAFLFKPFKDWIEPLTSMGQQLRPKKKHYIKP